MARDLFAGALPAGEYQSNVMKSPVSRKALKGDDYPLPEPYRTRDGILERDVLKQVKAILRLCQVWNRRIEGVGKIVAGKTGNVMIPGEMAGMSDIIAIVDGRMVAIEVKAPGGLLSSLQYSTLLGIHEAGGYAMVVCSAERLLAWLKSHDKGISTALIGGWLRVL